MSEYKKVEFTVLSQKVSERLDSMVSGELYQVDISNEEMWGFYLDAFPDGTNEIFRERREYDCQCCKNFIKNLGNVVTIKNGVKQTIWDVKVGGYYQVVVDAMNALILSKKIVSVFRTSPNLSFFGSNTTTQDLGNGDVINWNHFNYKVPTKFIKSSPATVRGDINTTAKVIERGLEEFTLSSADTIIDLVADKNLYRGEEFLASVKAFKKAKKAFDKLTGEKKEIYAWENVNDLRLRIRPTVIGTLLKDLSEGKAIEGAIKSFEDKMAGGNYKRTKAIFTKGMVADAVKTIQELGYEDSLQRRYSLIEDVNVNNVLFVDRNISPLMKGTLTDILMKEVKEKKPSGKIEEISIENFLSDVLPKAEGLELFFDNKLASNLVSLISPSVADSKNMLLWGNNFSWNYKGDFTDSMKENVKKAGGSVTGFMRFSIQWNDNNDNIIDLDAHCHEPNGAHIYYANSSPNNCKGRLDVDITQPRGVAVENITWACKKDIQNGVYTFKVKNYNSRTSGAGFTAQIEYDGVIHSFSYDKKIAGNKYVTVAIATHSVDKGLVINSGLSSSELEREEWAIKTKKWHKVESAMLSPNHWDDNAVGNKHYFFMIQDCVNDDKCRGLYNEFLSKELNPHRKVFDMLGDKLKCEASEQQLSGVGFSSTMRNEMLVRTSGSYKRQYLVKF